MPENRHRCVASRANLITSRHSFAIPSSPVFPVCTKYIVLTFVHTSFLHILFRFLNAFVFIRRAPCLAIHFIVRPNKTRKFII